MTVQNSTVPEPTTPARRSTNLAQAVIVFCCGTVLALTLLYLLVMPFSRAMAGNRDFAVYWATGQQLMHHGNPWDPAAMTRLERAAGFQSDVLYMRNPPWALPLAWPLGFFSARAAALPWSLLLLGLLAVSIHMLAWLLGGFDKITWLLAFSFTPALLCIMVGQTSLFLLLGLVLFLRLHATRPFLAGAALWLCLLKPHLFLPFGCGLLLWIVLRRRFSILFGAIAATVVASLLAWIIDPAAWQQYLHWSRFSGISTEFVPCLSVEFRNHIDPSASWLVFVPSALGCLWGVVHFWRRRATWDWTREGSLLMLVSLLVAPYSWIYDQSVVLPALIVPALRGSRARLAMLSLLFLVIELWPFLSSSSRWTLNLWPPVAWLAWYLYATHRTRAVHAPPLPAPAAPIPNA